VWSWWRGRIRVPALFANRGHRCARTGLSSFLDPERASAGSFDPDFGIVNDFEQGGFSEVRGETRHDRNHRDRRWGHRRPDGGARALLHEKYDITLFEKDGRLGGNAYTLHTRAGDDIDISVFSFSSVSYPNFYKLLSRLNIKTARYGISGLRATSYDLDTQHACYFAPLALRGLTPRRLAVSWRFYFSMKRAIRLFEEGRLDDLSMAEAMKLLPGLRGDAYYHMLFMLCLVSSMLYDEVMNAPAAFFIKKLRDHLEPGPTTFRYTPSKTKSYMDALSRPFPDRIVLNAKIGGVSRTETGVTLRMEDGQASRFDKVVFACNADQALALLDRPSEAEQRILGAWKYKEGLVVTHRDDTSFPPPRLRTLYDYLYTDRDGKIETSINACYRFQPGVSGASDLLGTQHPNFPIQEDRIEFQKVFRTPIFDQESVKSIPELPSLNGTLNTFYCGSHFGHGLHEDAVSSALAIAGQLGVRW
jgi:predicted NAD/FAD-binding protein